MSIKTLADVFAIARRSATEEEGKELSKVEAKLKQQYLFDFDPSKYVATYWDVSSITEGLDNAGSEVELTEEEAFEHLLTVIQNMDWSSVNESIDDYIFSEIKGDE